MSLLRERIARLSGIRGVRVVLGEMLTMIEKAVQGSTGPAADSALADEVAALKQTVEAMSVEVNALVDAHQVHRSSDQSFLRSLGQITEAIQAVEAKVVTMREDHAKLCNKVQPAVLHAGERTEVLSFLEDRLASVERAHGILCGRATPPSPKPFEATLKDVADRGDGHYAFHLKDDDGLDHTALVHESSDIAEASIGDRLVLERDEDGEVHIVDA